MKWPPPFTFFVTILFFVIFIGLVVWFSTSHRSETQKTKKRSQKNINTLLLEQTLPKRQRLKQGKQRRPAQESALQKIRRKSESIYERCQQSFTGFFQMEDVVDPRSKFFSNFREVADSLLKVRHIFRKTLQDMKLLSEEALDLLRSGQMAPSDYRVFEGTLAGLGVCLHYETRLFLEGLPEAIRLRREGAEELKLFVEKAYLDLSKMILQDGLLGLRNAEMAFGILRAAMDQNLYANRDIEGLH